MQRLILGPTVSGGGTVGADRHGGHQPSGLVREVLEGHSHFSVGKMYTEVLCWRECS